MNEVEMQQAVARAEGSRIAYEWMKKHIRDYEPCDSNSRLVGEWLEKNNLPLSEENLDRAAAAIGDRLARASATPATPVATPVASAEPPDDLPPLPPSWFQIKTTADVNSMSRPEFRRCFHAAPPWGENFRKRVEEIFRRAKGAR
jgi:hypothetical protein